MNVRKGRALVTGSEAPSGRARDGMLPDSGGGPHQFGREPLYLGAPARIYWSGRSKPNFIPSWEQPHSVPVPLRVLEIEGWRPAIGNFFVLQVIIQALRAACQNLALLLNHHNLHLGLQIFFLCHNSVLHSLLYHNFLTVHDVEAFRRLSYTATLQVVYLIINCQLSIVNCFDARRFVEAEE